MATYLLEELNIRSAKDFQMADKGGIVDAMQFIAVPIMKQDRPIVELIMKQSHLWTYEQYLQILNLMKQMKWTDGIT